MIIKDIPEQLVEILVAPHLEHGWEYTYWGKKITLEKGIDDKISNQEMMKVVREELDTENYEVPVYIKRTDLQWPCEMPVIYCACIYMDKHDGDSFGIVFLHENEVKEKVNNLVNEIKELLDWKDED